MLPTPWLNQGGAGSFPPPPEWAQFSIGDFSPALTLDAYRSLLLSEGDSSGNLRPLLACVGRWPGFSPSSRRLSEATLPFRPPSRGSRKPNAWWSQEIAEPAELPSEPGDGFNAGGRRAPLMPKRLGGGRTPCQKKWCSYGSGGPRRRSGRSYTPWLTRTPGGDPTRWYGHP